MLSKIMDPLLTQRFDFGYSPSALNGSCEEFGEIVKRYFVIKNDLECQDFPNKLFALGATGGTIYTTECYYIDISSGVQRMNTAAQPVEQFLKQRISTDVIVVKDQYGNIQIRTSTRLGLMDVAIILSGTPIFLPALCPNGLDEQDKKLIELLSKGDYQALLNAADRLVDEKLGDFRTAALEEQLRLFQGRTQEGVKNRIERDLEDLRSQIRELLEKISAHTREMAIKEEEYDALVNSPKGANDELLKFFKQHKQLKITDIHDWGMEFEITDTLKFYDKDKLGRQLKNPATLWGSQNSMRRAFITALLVEQKGTIVFGSKFTLDNSMTVDRVRGGVDSGVTTRMVHPHIDAYGCLGSFSSEFARLNSRREWDIAIETAISATKNINIDDPTVMRWFINRLFSDQNKYIKMKDTGEMVTAQEFARRVGIEGAR